MSDPLFSDTLSFAKEQHRKNSAVERDWWNRSSSSTKGRILGQLNFNDIGTYTASENAYQQDKTAKLNQLVLTKYDSLPESVKSSITETLIESGVLPNPSDFNGISNEYAIGKEVWHECDRCDESFMDEEDFDTHKEIDHGDSDELDGDAEVAQTSAMDPEADRFALEEARKAVETAEKDLYRDVYFNSDAITYPTVSEPDGGEEEGMSIAGKVGYDDNPNEGLYDNKKFKAGKASSRYGIENHYVHGDKSLIANKPTDSYFTFGDGDATCNVCGDKVVGGYGHYDHLQTHYSSEALPILEDQEDFEVGEVKNEDGTWSTDDSEKKFDKPEDAIKDSMDDAEEADNYPQTKVNDDWEDDFKQLKTDYEDRDTPVVYENNGVSDISEVTPTEHTGSPDEITSLQNVDFSQEKIDFGHYPVKASEGKQKSYLTEAEAQIQDEYEKFGEEPSEEEEVVAKIEERKIAGYTAENIANELRITYGVSHEDAISKVYSVEVSVNDKIAGTFFGKKYSECNEAEIQELKLYSGSVN